jgi:hypothetical protein
MDDFNVTSLHESKNEWGARLLTILTPLVVEGFTSIYDEALTLCRNNNELDKHLMTFQNFISRIPKWNASIIETEQKRIVEKSACSYLEDLITCVHVIQLKLLSAVRVGSKQKKIDISIPKIEDFIHRVYIISARKIYKNVYLFEKNIPPLQVQKNNRELELLVQESILNAVRESIPVDVLLRTYLDETIEEDVEINIHEEVLDQPIEEETPTSRYLDTTATLSSGPIDETITEPIEKTRLSFSNLDKTNTLENDDYEKEISTPEPKEVKSLEEDVSGDKLVISSSDAVSLTHTDVHDLDPPSIEVIPDLLIDDIEVI